MRYRFIVPLTIAFCGALGSALMVTAARGAIIAYDSLAGEVFSGGISSLEVGNTVTLDGDAREATRVELRLRLDLRQRDASRSLRLRFYEVDRFGYPETLFWESSLNEVQPGTNVVSIDLPNISVPTIFAWTVRRDQTDLRNPIVVLNAGPATIGSSVQRFSRSLTSGDNGGVVISRWQPWNTITPGSFGAVIYAVPEPAASVVLLIAMVISFASCRINSRCQSAQA